MTPDLQGIRNDICRYPTDSFYRSLYCDYLEDQGLTGTAAIIRQMMAESMRIEVKGGNTYTAATAAGPGCLSFTAPSWCDLIVCCGFVEGIRCDLLDLLKPGRAQLLFSQHPITSIDCKRHQYPEVTEPFRMAVWHQSGIGRSVVGPTIFRLLRYTSVKEQTGLAFYPKVSLALLELCRAAVNYGRYSAGLPLLLLPASEPNTKGD